MLGPVLPHERITTFLVHSTDFKSTRPTYNAFMPNSKGRRSVYRTSGLSHGGIVNIGMAHVEPIRGPLKGYGHQQAVTVTNLGLNFEPDGVPHERHANIIGWSGNKAKDRIAANKIAETASVVLYSLPRTP